MGSGDSPYDLSRTDAANDIRRRRPTWRRVVAAAVCGAFTLMLVTLGFSRYAHHPAYGVQHPVPNPN
jgi:hypothetical protein